MFNELISGLMTGDGASQEAFDGGLEGFKVKLTAQEVIRCYVDGTPNFGHQATTVHLIKRVVDLYEYTNTIQVFYAGGAATLGKLAVLFTSLNPNQEGLISIPYNGATINFYAYNDGVPPVDACTFGFTGGADNTDVNYADRLNVSYFLRLQPYNWRAAGGVGNFVANRIEFQGRPVAESVPLSEISRVFGAMPYGYDPLRVGDVPEAVWEWYGTTQQFDPALKAKVNNCFALMSAWAIRDDVKLWPTYGLHHFSEGAVPLLNLVLAATLYQRENPAPIVFTLINDNLDFSYIEQLIEGPAAFKLFLDYEVNNALVDQALAKFAEIDRLKAIRSRFARNLPEQIRLAENEALQLSDRIEANEAAINALMTQFQEVFAGIDFSQVIKLIPGAVNPGSITTIIRDLNDGEIAFVPIGSQPQEIFNCLYFAAEMPCVFEGQGTSSLVISLGKPYFQINKGGNNSVNYPQMPVVENPNAALNVRFQDISNLIRESWYDARGPRADYVARIRRIADCIGAIYTDGSPEKAYFANLGTFFQRSVYDKLQLGLVALNTFGVPAVAVRSLTEIAGGTALSLDDIYTALIAAWQNGEVDLFVALPDSKLKNYYTAIVGDHFIVAVAKDDITKSENAVTVKNANTDAFTVMAGGPFTIEIDFALSNSVIVSTVNCVAQQTWQIADIPWLEFSNPGFEMKVYEAEFPVQGGAFGTLKGADLTLSFDYPVENNTWVLTGEFESPYPSISTFYQMAGGINLVDSLPPPLNSMAGFGLSKTQLALNTGTKTLEYILFEMSTSTPWVVLSNPKIEIVPYINAVITDPSSLKERSTSFTIGGMTTIGGGTINVSAQYPDFRVTTELVDGEIDLGQLLADFGLPVLFQSTVSTFNMVIFPSSQYYHLEAAIKDLYSITIFNTQFSLTQLQFQVTKSSGDLSVNIAGKIEILPDDEKLELDIVLGYDSLLDWTFSAGLKGGEIPVGNILMQYIGWTTEKKYGISDLALTLTTKPKSFEFRGKTAEPWYIDFLDLSIAGTVKVGYISEQSAASETLQAKHLPLTLLADGATSGAYGEITANLNWHGVEVDLFYNFKPDYKAFGIQWGSLSGKVEQVKIKEKLCQVATLNFTESTTLGSIVETMVGWATGSKFSLGAPWNILDSVSLNNLQLTFNFTNNQVGLEIGLGPIDIGLLGINIASINKLVLSYNSNQKDASQNGVIVELQGTFNWQDNPSDPLTWDASKPETTPGPPAQGTKYVDLRLLAMGQHVELTGLDQAASVKDAINLMKNLPAPQPDQLPPLTINPDHGWLVGLDLGLLSISDKKKPSATGRRKKNLPAMLNDPKAAGAGYVFNMQIVFSDPDLYGLYIKLDGDAAKVFKGLEFEIMYRQVSQSVGVYQSQITLPDAMRYIRMGQFNIILPVFGIQVYTNGDFLVDLGFPWNSDFSRSFTLQTIIYVPAPIPVMGSIGLYFAKLSSATTTKVPATSLGIFNPVIAFGVGFQIGLGYSFDIGILSAGFQLTTFAIIEGVLAKWNPYKTDASGQNDRIEEDYYFAINGTLGVIGKLYGSVDFAIISASINIEIKIMAQFSFVPYEPIEIALVASVTASASIKILFIRISFSFSITIQHHLTLPSTSSGKAPWDDGSAKRSLRQLRRHERTALTLHRMRSALLNNFTPQWNNLIQAPIPQGLEAYLMFAVTMARNENETQPTLADQQACGVGMLMIGSVKAPQEDRESCRGKALKAGTDSAFELLSKQVLRWMIASMPPAPLTAAEVDALPVSEADLLTLLNYLNSSTLYAPIPPEAIQNFMLQQFRLNVSEAQSDVEATYFPMAPSIGFSMARNADPALAYSYGGYNASSDEYIAFIKNYFSQLAVKTANSKRTVKSAFALEDDNGPSVASFMFGDYYLLIAKQMLQMAINSLKNFEYPIDSTQTNDDIVTWVNTNGSFSEYSLEKLFEDNKSHLLNAERTITIAGNHYVAQTGDTFNSIAQKTAYGHSFTAQQLAQLNDGSSLLNANITITYPAKDDYITLPEQTLSDVAAEIGVSVTDLIANGNVVTAAGLLMAPASLLLPPYHYNTAASDTLDSICASNGITPELLGGIAANGTITDLFSVEGSTDLNFVQLSQFKVSELIKEMQYTQGLQHLAGLTSRYYLSGLRLPTAGLTPKYEGMWVTKDQEGNLVLPAEAGLFALTGQQVPLESLSGTDKLTLTYSSDAKDWIVFPGDKPLVLALDAQSPQNIQVNVLTEYATTNYLDTGLSKLGEQELFALKPATYTFNTAATWLSPAAVTMPYTPEQTPAQHLRLWKIPDSLLNLPDPSQHPINPLMSLQLGTYDEATQTMQKAPFTDYAWASRIDFTIKKATALSGSPNSATTYEVAGADGMNTLLLEKMVAQIGGNEGLVSSFYIAYGQADSQTSNAGIQTEDPSQLTIGLAQVNLSTETHPPSFSKNLLATEQQNLTSAIDFIRLLWEASITQQGGYYLFYYNQLSKTGLPDRAFDSQGNAKVSLIVVYSNQNANQLCNYMNTLATASQVDFSTRTLFAESIVQSHALSVADKAKSPAELAEAYYADLGDLIKTNEAVVIPDNTPILIQKGTYLAGAKTPGADPNAIAAYFGTTLGELQAANPQLSDWNSPLPDYTALYLPAITLTVKAAQGRNSFELIALYYNTTTDALALANKDAEGIFAQANGVTVSSGPFNNKPMVVQGEQTVAATRQVPSAIPDDPEAPLYAGIYLENCFSLLGYRIAANAFFKESNMAVPLSPSVPVTGDPGPSKFILPPLPGVEWEYRDSLPYYSEVLKSMNGALPDPANNPYQGIGDLLQIRYSWQDLYGNTLLSTLDDPTNTGFQNQFPQWTGYADSLTALSSWPSVSSNWQVLKTSLQPFVQLNFNFDANGYNGLLKAEVSNASGKLIRAVFTVPLDSESATSPDNYAFVPAMVISTISVDTDGKSVLITVEELVEGEISLNVKNILDQDKVKSYNGSASFGIEPSIPQSSALMTKAAGDAALYEKIWYQLSDHAGIEMAMNTSLVPGRAFILNAQQSEDLIREWIGPIYLYIADRAAGQTGVAAPPVDQTMIFNIDPATLETSNVFRLSLGFSIKRKRSDLALGTSADIREVSTTVAPYTVTGQNTLDSYSRFVSLFEEAFAGQFQLRIASGVDRFDTQLSGDAPLWVLKLKTDGALPAPALGYNIDTSKPAKLFAPKPVSNQLISRRGVHVYPFDPKTGIDYNNNRIIKDFIDTDLNLWCTQIFEYFDQVMSPEYTAAIQLVDYLKTPAGASFLDTLMEQKAKLADIIKLLMIPVFYDERDMDASIIRETYKQALLVKLSNAYAVRSGLQFEATVFNNNLDGDARLFGNVSQKEDTKIQNLEFTSSKIALKTGTTANTPFTFLLNAPQIVKGNSGEVLSALSLDLSFSAGAIEHQIGKITGIEGYEASTWLKFFSSDAPILGPQKLSTDPVKVPLPLNVFPDPPGMTSQQGEQLNVPGPYGIKGQLIGDALEDLLEWNYSFTYSQPFHYFQDILHFSVQFNLKPEGLNTLKDFGDAFNELAEMIYVLPDMKDAFDKLAAINPESTPEDIQEAVVTLTAYTTMVDKIITACGTGGLNIRKNHLQAFGSSDGPYHFSVQESSAAVDEEEGVLVVSVQISDEDKAALGAVPLVSIEGYQTVPLVEGCDSGLYCYYFTDDSGKLPASEGQGIAARELTLAGLNILARQDVSASVYLDRNAELIHLRKTNEPFVFTTGSVSFPNFYFPNFVNPTELNIANLNGDQPAGLDTHLNNLFNALLKKNEQPNLSFKVVVNYQYGINEMGNTIQLPVMMQPVQTVPVNGQRLPAEMIGNWAGLLSGWYKNTSPSENNAKFYFDLTIFSNLTDEPKPLIELSNLFLKVKDIVFPPDHSG